MSLFNPAISQGSMHFLKLLVRIVFCILLSSCTHYSKQLRSSLKIAGENREELIKTLEHFEDDSFKYAAATYLIENLVYQLNQSSIENEALSHLYCEVSENYPVGKRREKFTKGMYNIPNVNRKKPYFHVQTLTSDYLIPYIDTVCEMYLSQPWHNDYSFEIFAEYVLPYKLENESIENWRSTVFQEYSRAVNSINYEKGDTYEAEKYSSLSDTIIKTYTASGGEYVKLNEGDCYTLKQVAVNYSSITRLLISYFNGNDSTTKVSVCVGSHTIPCDFLSTGGWSIKYHNRIKCDFELEQGIYDFTIKVIKGSIGLDVMELKFNDYFKPCKTDFGTSVYQIYNPFMDIGISFKKGASHYTYVSVDSVEDHYSNFGFTGNDYGFYAISQQDDIIGKNTLDLLNYQYEDSGKVILWDKINAANQKWAFVGCGNEFYRIVNKYNGKCLTTDGENVFLLRYNGQDGQLWDLKEQRGFKKTPIKHGHLTYEKGDFFEAEAYTKDSTRIIDEGSASNGKYVKLNKGESITIQDINVGVDCVGSFLVSFYNQGQNEIELQMIVGVDTVVKMSNTNLKTKQFDVSLLKGVSKFKIEVLKGNIGLDVIELKYNDFLKNCAVDFKTDMEYEISNSFYEVGLTTTEKKFIELSVSSQNEEYTSFSFSPKESAFYKIIDKTTSNHKVLDLLDYQYEDSAKVILWNNIGNLNQDWLFILSAEGMYRIINRYSGKCITTDGTNVFLMRFNEGENQLWAIKEKNHCPRIDVLIKPNSAISMAARLTEEIQDFDFYAFPSELYNPSATELIKYKAGSCLDEVRFIAIVNRAFGVPIAYDYVLQWPFRNDRHWWPVLIGSNGEKIKYYVNQKPYEDNYYDNYPKGKVFRKTYTPNKDAIIFKEKLAENVPPLLRNLFYKDVTAEYEKVYTVNTPIYKQEKSNTSGYVCVFDNQNWVPIWAGDCKEGKCEFVDLTSRAMYLPVFYDQGSIESFYAPFNIEENGRANYRIPRKDSLIDVTLNRKYPFIHWSARLSNNVRGGIFEGSNDPSFKNADVLWKVDFYVDGQYYEKLTNTDKTYKYFRYNGPSNSFCMINEIMLSDENGKPLKGKIIGTPGSFEDRGETLERVFDGDILTGFNAPFGNGAWVGYAFPEKVHITKIGFIPRNDGNIIEPGDNYELEYYDSGWVSCGQLKANQYQITFPGVPANALHILHNRTKGREERIFTYKDGKQIWW